MGAFHTKEDVYARLDELGISYQTTDHPAVYTIGEMEELGIPFLGEVCKNLFLRDDKGKRHFLLTLRRFKSADLKSIRGQLGTTRLGFASEKRLEQYLGLHQGEVSPMGLLNDTEAHVEMLFDRELEGAEVIGVHPNDNTATVWLSYNELRRMIEENGNSVNLVTIE